MSGLQLGVDALVRESAGRVSRPLAAFLVRFAAYQEGHADGATAPPLNPLQLDALIARAAGTTEDVGAVTVRLQAAYDEAYARARRRRAATVRGVWPAAPGLGFGVVGLGCRV